MAHCVIHIYAFKLSFALTQSQCIQYFIVKWMNASEKNWISAHFVLAGTRAWQKLVREQGAFNNADDFQCARSATHYSVYYCYSRAQCIHYSHVRKRLRWLLSCIGGRQIRRSLTTIWMREGKKSFNYFLKLTIPKKMAFSVSLFTSKLNKFTVWNWMERNCQLPFVWV